MSQYDSGGPNIDQMHRKRQTKGTLKDSIKWTVREGQDTRSLNSICPCPLLYYVHILTLKYHIEMLS